MSICRVARLTYHDVENGQAVIPLNGVIVGLDRIPASGALIGVWVEETIDRFDPETGQSYYRDEHPLD